MCNNAFGNVFVIIRVIPLFSEVLQLPRKYKINYTDLEKQKLIKLPTLRFSVLQNQASKLGTFLGHPIELKLSTCALVCKFPRVDTILLVSSIVIFDYISSLVNLLCCCLVHFCVYIEYSISISYCQFPREVIDCTHLVYSHNRQFAWQWSPVSVNLFLVFTISVIRCHVLWNKYITAINQRMNYEVI